MTFKRSRSTNGVLEAVIVHLPIQTIQNRLGMSSRGEKLPNTAHQLLAAFDVFVRGKQTREKDLNWMCFLYIDCLICIYIYMYKYMHSQMLHMHNIYTVYTYIYICTVYCISI